MNLPRKSTVEWAVGISVVAIMFAAGLTLIILSQDGALHARPWSYVGLASAGLSAVLGMALAIAEADITSGGDSDERE